MARRSSAYLLLLSNRSNRFSPGGWSLSRGILKNTLSPWLTRIALCGVILNRYVFVAMLQRYLLFPLPFNNCIHYEYVCLKANRTTFLVLLAFYIFVCFIGDIYCYSLHSDSFSLTVNPFNNSFLYPFMKNW